MKMVQSLIAAFLSVMTIACASTGPRSSEQDDSGIREAIGELLDRYAKNDQHGVVEMLDAGGFVVYGTDLAEQVDTPAELRELMSADFRLWGTASFGAVQDLSIEGTADFASAHFHVPFFAGGRGPVMVRFSTAWRRQGGEWQLVQSANSVPTSGMSAAELTK